MSAPLPSGMPTGIMVREPLSMREPLAKKRMRRATLKDRRQEIEVCLAAFGLMPERGRFIGRPNGVGSQEMHSHTLCRALESLGPVFSAFGIYLSSRVDLLPVNACLDLARIVDQVEMTPISAVRELITQEFDCPPEEIYSTFEEVPFESRLMFQSHHALLENGTAVTVKVIHSAYQEQYEFDLELLPLLKVAFSGDEWGSLSIENAIVDFRYTLEEQIDFIQEIKALEELTQDERDFELLRVPVAFRDLCSSKLTTIEQLPGLSLHDTIALYEKRGSGEHATTGLVSEDIRLDANDLARRLCLVWLRQVLLGSWFPAELHGKKIVVLPNRQIAFTGGEFARLPSDSKKNLWQYLIATSTEDPDKACSCLLGEMIQEGRPFDEEELRHRFRGIVPFRDGGWSTEGDSRSLAEHLFVHWKLASERGLRPQRHLLAFYRGLFQTTAQARQLTPYSDPLLDGLQEVRTIEILAQFRDMLGPSQLSDNLDRYAAMMMGLPQKLDEVLTLVAESGARARLQSAREIGHRREQNSSAVVITLLLVLAAVVLLVHHVSVSTSAGVWFDRVSALVFMVVGALLLRAISRGR
jgi:predicted unusual protein kinase regulating ubiquinone biosynthesis (AarF/ABC1/UbiB family)